MVGAQLRGSVSNGRRAGGVEDEREGGLPVSERRSARLVVDYAEDTDRCMRVIAQLTEEYERYVESEHATCPDCPVVRSGPFVVYSMLEWKAIYGDGRLDHWTVGDIHTYLLEHFPRKVSADRGLLGDTPSCVRDFVYFMSDRGTLAGEDSSVLADAAEEVFDEFLAANRDRRNWGLAKLMLNGGAAILDDEDEDHSMHLATVPAVSVESPRVAGSSNGQRAAARRKRKAIRAARRRNRR